MDHQSSVHCFDYSNMNTLILCGLALIAVVVAVPDHHEDNGPAFYKFEYGVHDPHTHDIKSQHEHLDGKHLTGGYTLKEADGTTRVVKYFSDPHKGFNAVVERRGHAQHPTHGHGHATSYVGTTHFGYGGH